MRNKIENCEKHEFWNEKRHFSCIIAVKNKIIYFKLRMLLGGLQGT